MASPAGVDRFLIAPFKSGLQKDLEPWLTPEDSFEELNNAYVFRGKVRKRFGSSYTGTPGSIGASEQLGSRLRVNIGTTDGAGAITVNPVPGAKFKVGQMYSIGAELFTVIDVSAGAQALLTTGAGSATFDSTTSILAVTGAANTTDVFFYPSEPVMGFAQFEVGPINDHSAYAFDTQFAYKFSGTFWDRVGTQRYKGTNAESFWVTNWDGAEPETTAMFSTNFNTTSPDSMYYTLDGATWTEFEPKFLVAGTASQNIITTAQIILPFKNRLVLLNTYEVDAGAAYTSFTNRCRYSHNGSPLGASAWLEPDEVGGDGAGFLDAPTEEAIISAEFIRDRLIVYFERSTWELAYTGNEVLPFNWQKLNTELGSESTFSSVPFDKEILNIGPTGIHACNGVNVQRIDDKIPDEVFKTLNSATAVKRIHGIRDYYSELVYWTFPTALADDDNAYPDKVLVYNYKNNTWALNDDCVTAWGYLEQTVGDTWQTDFEPWLDDDSAWNSGIKLANHREVIAGNQQGFVFVVDESRNSNASVLQITEVNTTNNQLTVVEHNLNSIDYLKLSNIAGITGLDAIYQITKVDDDTISLNDAVIAGTYLGGGTAAQVSKISIKSKEWNPYISDGNAFYLNRINFCVSRTDNGEIGIDYFQSSSGLGLASEGSATGTNIGSFVLETSAYDLIPLEITQDRVWHSIHFDSYSFGMQLQISFTDAQLLDDEISGSAFELQGLILETRRANLL